MIVLSGTSDAVRIDLASAHTTSALQCISCWRDITTSAYTPGRALSLSNGTTAADIVAAPAASTQRVVDFLAVVNTDTVAHTVTLELYDGTNAYPVWKGALAVGERVEFSPGVGFRVFTSGGLEKVQSMIAGGRPIAANWQFKWISAEYTHTTGTTVSDITGLNIDVVAGNYYYAKYLINVRTSATTTGARCGWVQSAGFVTSGYAACRLVQVAGGSSEVLAYSSVSAGTSSTATALAQRYGGNLFSGEVLFVPEATTTAGLKVQIAAEVAGDIWVEPGSVLMYCEYTP